MVHLLALPVVVNQLHAPRVAFEPDETDSPLIVHADAVLASAFAPQRIQPVAWGRPQVVEAFRPVDHQQLRANTPLNLHRNTSYCDSRENRGSVLATEALDHAPA